VEVRLTADESLLVKDTQAVALIAYLQRLGVDLFKPIDPPVTEGEVVPALADENAPKTEPVAGEEQPTVPVAMLK
jgi:hypothetical protein